MEPQTEELGFIDRLVELKHVKAWLTCCTVHRGDKTVFDLKQPSFYPSRSQ